MNFMNTNNELLMGFEKKLLAENPNFGIGQNQFMMATAFHAAGFANFATANVEEFGRSLRLGDGIDIRSFLSQKSSPFVPSTYASPPVKNSELVIEYMYGATNVASSLGGGTELSASLNTPKFSIGPKFKSSAMREQQSERIDGHLVIRFKPTYDFMNLGDESLTPTAQNLLDTNDLKAFYGRYGTHFVSSVLPSSVYAAIFSFYFDTQSSRQSFEQTVGLSLGIMQVFNASFSNSVKTALTTTHRQVSLNFREFAATEVGIQPLRVPVAGGTTDPALDLLSPAELITRYNTYIASLPTATNVPIIEVRLRPLADIIAPATSAVLPTSTLELSASIKANIEDMLGDFNVMIQSPSVWKDVTPNVAQASSLALQRDKLSDALLDVIIDPSEDNVEILVNLSDSAAQEANQFFDTEAWPVITAVKLISSVQPNPPDNSSTVELKFRSDGRLAKPFIALHGNTANASGVSVIVIDLIKDESENEPDRVFWRSGPVVVKPVTDSAIRIEAIDSVGRTREAVLFAGADQTTPQLPTDRWTEMY